MSSSTLTSILFASLLDSPAVVELASPDKEKAFDIIKEHFTFSPHEITHAYQNSYRYALTVVCLGLTMPENRPFADTNSEIISREFSEQLEQNYLQPFVAQQQVPNLDEFRQQAIETLKLLTKNTEKLFEIKEISEQDLAAFINYREPLAITDIALEQMQRLAPVHDTLAAFLRYQELLGNAILFFFRERLSKDEQQRLQKTQTALQQKGFCLEMQQLHSAIETAQQKLNHAIAEQSANLVELAQQLQQLQQTQMAWQTNHQSLTHFAQCFGNRADILVWAKNVYTSLKPIEPAAPEKSSEAVKISQEPVSQTNDLVLENLQKINQFLAKNGLSSQISPRDELVQFDSHNLQLIQELVQKLTQLPTQHPQYSQLSIKIGRVLSSIGELASAERLFLTAIEKANKRSDQALACYNLFQIRWRKAYSATPESAKQPIYAEALTALQAAIKQSNGRYALHDINKGYYPIEKILSVGGMGCVLLCQNHNYLLKKHPLVVVKCFWGNVAVPIEKVFKDSFIMHEIASDIVPEPLDFGYADNLNKRHPYFLTEYIEDAIDGEAWLEKYGPLSLETGLQVALQIAEGLQIAHNKGIYHLDLKPANLLLLKAHLSKEEPKSVGTPLADSNRNISVKIIDFGLTRVTSSLQQAVERRSRSGLMVFGQTVFGTLDYAPPEQQGFTQYGKPSAKSDLFSFGATMYRLWTGNSPRHFRERELPNVPALRDLLFDCVADNPQKRPQSTTQLIDSLKAIEATLFRESDKEITAQSNDDERQIDRSEENQVFQLPSESRKTNLNLVSQPIIEKAKQPAEEQQDETAWQSAIQKDTLAAYQAYLDGSTLKKHADDAKQRLTQKHQQAQQQAKEQQDETAWQLAIQKDMMAAYQAYLDGPTLKKHAQEAKQRLTQKHQQAQQEAKQQQDETAWQSAIQKNTMAAYQAYLDGATLKKHAHEAKQRLTEKHQQAQQQAKEQQDETAWQLAIQKDTMAAYQAYLDGATLKKHAHEAKQRLTEKHQQAEKKAKEQQDETAWQLAIQKDTLAAYQAYLYGSTLKKYAASAKQRLAQKHQQAEEKAKEQQDETAWQSDNTQAANRYIEEDQLLVEKAKEAETEDQQAWQLAEQQDTQSAYQAYLNSQTLKKHAKEAETRLIKLVEDETAWQRAVQKDNQAAYQAYLDGRTVKKHAQEANQRLITKTEEDENAWQQAQQQNTPAAYQAYLDGQTFKNYAQEAKQRLIEKTQQAEEEDEKAWQQAIQQNTPAAYQAYLDGQTLKIHAEDAEQKLVEKTTESEEDEQAWKNAEEEDNIEAYQDYLYGQTIKRHAKEAKQRLREKAKETEDEKAWQLALQQDTQQSYQTYLYGQTIKIYAQEAKQRLTEKTDEAEEQDEQAWQQALEQDTQTAYQAYLEGPTLQKHLHEAKQRLIEQAKTAEDDQAWQQAQQQDTLSAYQAYLEGLTIKNYTEEAKQRLLEKTKEIEKDEKAWQLVEQKDTQAAYQTYLDGQTLKTHAQEAQQRLIEKTKAAEQDEKAWQLALQQDTQSAYQTYLDGLTVKTHADEALQRLKAFVHKTFKFKIITVNAKGETIQSRPKQAIYDIEDLGNGITLEMVYIPGGTFIMGAPINENGSSNDEYPQHQVSIKPVWFSKYPITQAQWQAMMGKNPSNFQGTNRPVEQVSWHDAINFCQRLSEKTGHQYHLPSEAQWEYACRAGTTTPFHFGHTMTTALANYDGNEIYASEAKGVYRQQTTEVGQFFSNAFGLYDMHGNVGEWCADLWHENYQNAPTDGSVWDKGGEKSLRLLRGGSWNDTSDDCRSAYRSWYNSTSRNDLVGFRVVTMDWD